MTATMALTYPEALKDVKARVAASRTSFSAGMAALPKDRRDGMYALYAFCREVDDIADDGATLESRREGLQNWRLRIAALFRGQQGADSITTALAPAIKQFGLVEKDFQDIIDGMEMDAGDPISAPDMETLDLYCDRVASAVGRVSVRIFGDGSSRAMKVSHHLGRALQLTNILRDLAEDAERGRLYLPRELLEKHGIHTRDAKAVLRSLNLPPVCRALAAVAAGHFKAADQAMRECFPAAMRPARIMRDYYGAILQRLIASDWRDPSMRIRLPGWQKLYLVIKNLT